jgi:dinuclear metal center YbgI/SA1388 family protein
MLLDVTNFLKVVDRILPPGTAMKGDPTGLQVYNGNSEITNILVGLEATDDFVDEAIARDCNFAVVFHPLIYRPLKEIHPEERVARLVSKLIRSDINLFAVHTRFDAYSDSTAKMLAGKLNLDYKGFIEPVINYEDYGYGAVCTAVKPLKTEQLAGLICERLSGPVKYCEGRAKPIEKVAIMPGSGGSFIEKAYQVGADAVITADLSYHVFHAWQGRVALFDIGHYEMEQFVNFSLGNLLKNLFPENPEKIFLSQTVTNPVRYYPENGFESKQRELLKN